MFAYNKDKLDEKFSGRKFDLIMLRSSIIFCDDLNTFIKELSRVLKPGGAVLIETILPTPEVFWWQQMEFKFNQIYSEQKINEFMERHGMTNVFNYEEYGNYTLNKMRSKYGIMKTLFYLDCRLANDQIVLSDKAGEKFAN